MIKRPVSGINHANKRVIGVSSPDSPKICARNEFTNRRAGFAAQSGGGTLRDMTVANIAPLPPRNFVDDAELAASVAHLPSKGQFEAAGMQFDFKIAGYFDVAEAKQKLVANGAKADHQHDVALNEGYPYCYRLMAVGTAGHVYAVWEVYSKAVGTLARAKSRTIEVDVDWTGKGIGSAFVRLVRTVHPVEWSGHFSPAGAKLKDRVESSPATPDEP
jgi:GNAT superfamily N-acetyltransferase